MKKLRFTAFALIIVLSALLISGCAKQTISQQDDSELMQNDLTAEQDNAKYEKLSLEWFDKDIQEMTLRKTKYYHTITDKDEITKLLNYLKNARVVSKEEIGATEGWTYGINIVLQDGTRHWLTLSDSGVRWNNDSETQTICTVETDYFKPLIEKLDSDLLKLF